MEGGHIEVKASKSKTQRRRLVPIADNLRAWLKNHVKKPCNRVRPLPGACETECRGGLGDHYQGYKKGMGFMEEVRKWLKRGRTKRAKADRQHRQKRHIVFIFAALNGAEIEKTLAGGAWRERWRWWSGPEFHENSRRSEVRFPRSLKRGRPLFTANYCQ